MSSRPAAPSMKRLNSCLPFPRKLLSGSSAATQSKVSLFSQRGAIPNLSQSTAWLISGDFCSLAWLRTRVRLVRALRRSRVCVPDMHRAAMIAMQRSTATVRATESALAQFDQGGPVLPMWDCAIPTPELPVPHR